MLLDTHAVLWWVDGSPRLGEAARGLIMAGEVLVSAATLWEVGIKHGLGKLALSPARLAPELRRNEFVILAITAEHCERVAGLPPHHRDPFDRMLVAQALVEGMPLMTADRHLARYGVETISCS